MESTLNPPILGDFEFRFPQNWGARGAEIDFCKRSNDLWRMINHRERRERGERDKGRETRKVLYT
jgi:hypothetical protein